jgi:PDZ domain
MAQRRRTPRIAIILLVGIGLGGLWARNDRQAVEAARPAVERQPRLPRSLALKPGNLEDLFSEERPGPDASREEIEAFALDLARDMADLERDTLAIDVALVYPDDRDAALDGFVESRGCHAMGRLKDGEGRILLTEATSPCAVRARITDGLLTRFGEWSELDLRDVPTSIELVISPQRQGGLGIQIERVEEGIAVGMVYPGTPAARLGLQPGDVIVEVDGMPTSALALQDFVEIATGPEGSRVELVVEHPGDTGSTEKVLEAVRAYMDEESVNTAASANAEQDSGQPEEPWDEELDTGEFDDEGVEAGPWEGDDSG